VRDDELIIVGDRIFTDVVMVNRMKRSTKDSNSLQKIVGPLAIYTTGVWERESMVMRWCEKKLVAAVERWVGGNADSSSKSEFIKREPGPTLEGKAGIFRNLWNKIAKS
jgi:phosphatidylglycerophosphatase GEP4